MKQIDLDTIGVWTLRLALVIGGIIAGMMGNKEVSSTCFAGLILSFFFL